MRGDDEDEGEGSNRLPRKGTLATNKVKTRRDVRVEWKVEQPTDLRGRNRETMVHRKSLR